jgi:hypothetical protein
MVYIPFGLRLAASHTGVDATRRGPLIVLGTAHRLGHRDPIVCGFTLMYGNP